MRELPKWLYPKRERIWKIEDASYRGIPYHIYKHRLPTGQAMYSYRIDYGEGYDMQGKWLTETLAHNNAKENIDHHIENEKSELSTP